MNVDNYILHYVQRIKKKVFCFWRFAEGFFIVGFGVLTLANLKIRVLWSLIPCSLVNRYLYTAVRDVTRRRPQCSLFLKYSHADQVCVRSDL
jgi:hypothetical protein